MEEERYVILEEMIYRNIVAQFQNNNISPIVATMIMKNVENRFMQEAFSASLLSRVVMEQSDENQVKAQEG